MLFKSIKNLSNDELMRQFSAVSRWDHYDPTGRPSPSKFELDELDEELRRRLSGAYPAGDEDAEDEESAED